MQKEEMRRKISQVHAFCQDIGVSTEELFLYLRYLTEVDKERQVDILYDDMTVSRRIDLEKNPIAIKVEEDALWVYLTASTPQKMTVEEAETWMKSLSPINGKPWRIPTGFELSRLFEGHNPYIEELSLIRTVFGFGRLFQIKEGAEGHHSYFGCSVYWDDGAIRLMSPFYPDMYCDYDNTAAVYWLPVCDAE